MKIFCFFIAITLIAFTNTACSFKPSRNNSSAKPQYPFVDEVNKLVNESKYSDSCDDKDIKMKMEIAKAIDARYQKIASFNPTDLTNEINPHTYKIKKFGPTKLYVKNLEPVIENKNGKSKTVYEPKIIKDESWYVEQKSWQIIKEIYDEAVSQDTVELWYYLTWKFQSILTDDLNRQVNLANMNIDRKSIDILGSIINKLEKCKTETLCPRNTFDGQELKILDSTFLYKTYFSDIVKKSNFKNNIEALILEVNSDLSRYKFNFNFNINKSSKNELEIKLYSDSFRGFESLFNESIKKFWEKSNLKLNITWVDSVKSDLSSIIYFINQVGGRSFVYNYDMYLYPEPTDILIAHEFGHILGFRDFYYTTWNTETCSYTVEHNEGDLMSSGEFVPDKHINTLKNEYGL